MSATGVMTAVTIVVASTESNELLNHGSLSMRPVIAGFLLGIPLFMLDNANEELATRFIILIIIAALLLNGNALLKLITAAPNAVKGK